MPMSHVDQGETACGELSKRGCVVDDGLEDEGAEESESSAAAAILLVVLCVCAGR